LHSFYENRTAILLVESDREEANEMSAKRAKMCGMPGENVAQVKRLHFTIIKEMYEVLSGFEAETLKLCEERSTFFEKFVNIRNTFNF
jgi:hypothetical protein